MHKRKIEENFITHIIDQELQNEDFLKEIIGAGGLTPLEALNVYRTDYNARLAEALKNKYEGVSLIAGDELFFYLTQLFLIDHISNNPDLQKFGDQFPYWLKNSAPLDEGMKFLSEVALVDLSFHQLFHLDILIGNNIKLDLNPDLLYFNPQSPLLLINVKDSGYSTWSYRYEDQLPTDFDWNKEEYLLIYKNQERSNLTIKLDLPLYNFLKKFLAGESLIDSLSIISEDLNESSSTFKSYQILMKIFIENHFLLNKEKLK